MARIFNLNKTSQQKLSKFIKTLDIDNKTDFSEAFLEIVKSDVRYIKDCSEKNIVDFYIEEANQLILNDTNIDDIFFDILKTKVRNKLAIKYTSGKEYDNNIDIYFNEVKREYIKHPQTESDNLEFLPENRDVFIKNNLKLVIDCAKRYQNLGLPFEDLIQIGNYGLLVAFDKFDKDRANLRFSIIKNINASSNEDFSYTDAECIIRDSFSYSKNLDATLKKIPREGFISKQEFIEWTNKNVKTAVFASVAFQWIRAYILLELNKLCKVIRVPKSAQKEDFSVNIVRLDGLNPHTDDCYHDNQISEIANDEFIIEDENMENMEKQNLFKDLLNKILYKLGALDRRIIMKRFGIDMPYQLSVNEIAESEGISSNKVKYSISNTLKFIANNIGERDKAILIEMLQ